MNYRRYYDETGERQCHVIETRYGRFEGESRKEAEMYAAEAERAHHIAQERAEAHRQMVLEEQRAVLSFNESRRGA